MSLGNVNLTPQLVQSVRDAVDIVAIASEHTRLRKAGRRYQGLCPMHKEKSPSFSVDPVQGLFYCFGCGAGGDAIKLHMLTTGDDFPAAIETLAQRYGIPLPSRAVRAGGPPERDLDGALAAAARFFTEQLRRSPVAQQYLAGRQVSPELAERFGLGYAPESWQALRDALVPRVPLADLEAAGLVGRSDRQNVYDRFRHRLIFPIHNPAGRLVGFGGRTLGDDKAKYVNTAETDRFHKGHLLYGLFQARQDIRESRRAVLVEGYFDVIGTVASGETGAVAGMGTALTQEQARLLARYADEVVVAYDGDRAGEAAFERALPILLAEGLGVRRARFGAGHDPDSLRLESGPAAVKAAIEDAEDGVVLQLRNAIPGPTLSSRLKSTQAAAITALLDTVRDPMMRHDYVRRAAEMLGLPEKEFSSRLKELKGWQGVDPAGRVAAGHSGASSTNPTSSTNSTHPTNPARTSSGANSAKASGGQHNASAGGGRAAGSGGAFGATGARDERGGRGEMGAGGARGSHPVPGGSGPGAGRSGAWGDQAAEERGDEPYSPRLVRSVEEQALMGLLQAGSLADLPPAASLPPEEVFFDPECRNIYRCFRALYAEGGVAVPDARAVMAKLAAPQATVDRMAHILLEEPVDSEKFRLSLYLDKLIRRWRQQRLRELQSEIVEAQRRRDGERLASLIEERTNLSQSLQGVRPGESRKPG